MSSPTNWMKKEYDDLVKKGFDWKPPVIGGPSTGRAIIDDKERIMLCANNYLSMSNHPKVKQAAIDAVKSHGAGSGSVRPIAGNMDIHNELEDTIARFKNREAALYYQTGFAVNSGLIPQLAGKNDSIISDQLNHGSIIDGVRLSGVKKENRTIYAHNDMGELEDRLKEATKKSEKTLVISDGVFSMDGDIAPLPEIVALAKKYDAFTFIDECHATGVFGENGKGTPEYFGLEGEIDIINSTLGKALGGGTGGYTAASQEVVDVLRQKGRPYLFSNSIAPSVVCASLEVFKMLHENTDLIKSL